MGLLYFRCCHPCSNLSVSRKLRSIINCYKVKKKKKDFKTRPKLTSAFLKGCTHKILDNQFLIGPIGTQYMNNTIIGPIGTQFRNDTIIGPIGTQ